MNLSGESIAEIVNFYKLDPESEMLIIFDDISLAPGNIRVRKKGSAGGHNGIKSIISSVGTSNFMRIKVGVGEKPQGWDLADHVLGRFSGDELCKGGRSHTGCGRCSSPDDSGGSRQGNE